MNTISMLPDDFPRAFPPGAVSGAQNKVLARRIDGRYVVGWTDDELLERHAYCEDLVQQLVEYCMRKERENPDWTREFNLDRMAKGLAQKARSGEWDITDDEQDWMTTRVEALLAAREATPLAPELLDRINALVQDVAVDLDAPLSPEDE